MTTEDSNSQFCGSRLERQYACVCHDTAVEHTEPMKDCTEDPLCLAPMRDHEHDEDVPQVDTVELPARILSNVGENTGRRIDGGSGRS